MFTGEWRRYPTLVCFLWQNYRDTIDHLADMHDKVMNRVYNQAQKEIDDQTRKQRRVIRTSLATLRMLVASFSMKRSTTMPYGRFC